MKKFLLLTLPLHKWSSDFQRIFFDFCWKVITIFYVSAGNFVEKYFFRKRYLFHHFRTFVEKNQQDCQTLSFGKLNFIIHGHGVIFFRPLFLINFCRGSRNSILRVKRIALMKIIFFLEILYIFFSIFLSKVEPYHFSLLSENLRRTDRTAVYVSIGTSRRKENFRN